MKSILFLSSWYPSRVHSTLGNFVNYHAQSVSLKHNVNILYITPDKDVGSYELDHFKNENLTTTIVYFKKGYFKYINYWLAFLKGLNFLIKEKKNSFDLVHMNVMLPAVWQAIYLKLFFKLPFIVSEHWHGFQNLSINDLPIFKKLFVKFAFKSAYAVCPVTNQLKNAMEKSGFKSNFKVIPNVVDTSLFKISDEKYKEFTFLHVSTLQDNIKNVSGIIEAFKHIKVPSCKLKIVGDGKTDWIHQMVNDYQLKDHIIVEGEKTHQEIANEMQMVNAFVLFSNIENLPLVIIEAMASGIPIIATRVGGLTKLISDDFGLLVKKGDIKELVNGMKFVMENYNKYNSSKIREYAVSNFSLEVVGNQFDKLYSKMIKN
tara:strand:+ start:29873 stop:30994 length:1122 start_codon:yes stop_codon:yes gene_type:complete